MKNSRTLKVTLALMTATLSLTVNAADRWTGCLTVHNVANHLANTNDVLFSVSPLPSGCTAFGAGTDRLSVAVGQEGVTAENIKSNIALLTVAYLTNKKVNLYIGPPPTCYVQIVALGGYAPNQCP